MFTIINIFPHFENALLQNFGFGVVIKNILQLNDYQDSLPREFRFIAEDRYHLADHKFFLVFNYSVRENAISDYDSKIYFGFEYGYRLFSVRTGLNEDVISFGSGIKYKNVALDWGYGDYKSDFIIFNAFHNFSSGIFSKQTNKLNGYN